MLHQTTRDRPTESDNAAMSGSAAAAADARSDAPRDVAAAEWAYGTIRDLSAALQARRISARELTEFTIARIEALDPRLNAVVVRDFERARAAAAAADAALARGEQAPLLGVPVTFKEAIDISGLSTSWGFSQFANFIAPDDAVVVSRVRRAGAVVLGKTNLSKGLGDFQSYNDVYGTTNNPWDVTRTPGGSSGGSAAALAAGFGALSFGSDIGGSVRMPAHFCGVYAHKPTHGLVPMRGYGPPPLLAWADDGDLAVIGPMARSAADLALALDVIAGPDAAHDGVGYRWTRPAPRHDRLGDFRVLVVETHPLMPVDTTVRAAMARLTERLAKAGVRIAHADALLPPLADSARLYMRLLGAARSGRLSADDYRSMQRSAAALAPSDTGLAAQRERGAVISHRDWLAADAARVRLAPQWNLFFRDWDVIVYPAAPVPAFRHDHSDPIDARQIEIDGKAYPYYDACYVWADPSSTFGLPATAAPIDRSPTGLPIGVQVIGPYLEDRTTIAFAELMEREFGGFVPPPGYAASGAASAPTAGKA